MTNCRPVSRISKYMDWTKMIWKAKSFENDCQSSSELVAYKKQWVFILLIKRGSSPLGLPWFVYKDEFYLFLGYFLKSSTGQMLTYWYQPLGFLMGYIFSVGWIVQLLMEFPGYWEKADVRWLMAIIKW